MTDFFFQIASKSSFVTLLTCDSVNPEHRKEAKKHAKVFTKVMKITKPA